MISSLAIVVALLLLAPLLGQFGSSAAFSCTFAFPPDELCRSAEAALTDFQVPVRSIVAGVLLFLIWQFRPKYSLQIKRGSRRRTLIRFLPFLLSLSLLLFCWHLAWSRHLAFQGFQEHTYVLIWCSYICCCNCLEFALRGSCIAWRAPLRFFGLFPLSALYWWSFEYLNRFSQNWEYVLARHYSASDYALLASLSFTTVLPAVFSTALLLEQLMPKNAAWSAFFSPKPLTDTRFAQLLFALAVVSLIALPIFPAFLYPLLWLAPLLLLYSVVFLREKKVLFPEILNGNWQRWAQWMLASLICGFFWELFNFNSQSKWIYHIPFLGFDRVFEMPLAGYLGYLPFGLICAYTTAALFPEFFRKTPGC